MGCQIFWFAFYKDFVKFLACSIFEVGMTLLQKLFLFYRGEKLCLYYFPHLGAIYLFPKAVKSMTQKKSNYNITFPLV